MYLFPFGVSSTTPPPRRLLEGRDLNVATSAAAGTIKNPFPFLKCHLVAGQAGMKRYCSTLSAPEVDGEDSVVAAERQRQASE